MSSQNLIAEDFLTDTRVVQAKSLLLAALADHQKKITEVKPANSERTQSYAETIARFEDIRGGKMYFPYLGSGIGKRCLVELADGSVKFDFINGVGVHHFGHSHPSLVAAAFDAACSDTIMAGNLQQNSDSEKFSRLVLEAAQTGGSKLKHCFVSSSGVMSAENAFKMVFQKKSPADRVFVFENCFMGRTLAMSQMTDKAAYREGLPLNYNVDTVPFFDAADPQGSTERALKVIRKCLKRYPGRYAAMSFELVLGEGGFYPGSREFFTALMTELKAAGVAILVDEVQSFARTTELFAFQYFGLQEFVDIVWFGKASQACVTLFTAEYKPRPGLISQTYTASVSAIRAGTAVLAELLSDGYFGENGKIKNLQNHVHQKLSDLAKRHPDLVAGPFGVGTMVAFTPFGGDAVKVNAFVQDLYKAGVIGFTAGANPTRVRFLLPVGAISPQEFDAAMSIVEATLVATVQKD